MHSEEGWALFLKVCLEMKNASHLEKFFSLFLTIEEKEHLSSRMQIIKALLDKNLSQRDMSEHMKVSISQITRGSNALKRLDDEFLKLLRKKLLKYENDDQ